MPDTPTPGPALDTLAEQVNHLYWTSSSTVDEIVQRLGISRNTLYASIEPWSAGATCPDCGQPLWFMNRSNRNQGVATCDSCDTDVDLTRPQRETSEGAGGQASAGGGFSRWREDLSEVTPERVVMIGGAAVLGVLVGVTAVHLVRARR